jgi:hypothetical protein
MRFARYTEAAACVHMRKKQIDKPQSELMRGPHNLTIYPNATSARTFGPLSCTCTRMHMRVHVRACVVFVRACIYGCVRTCVCIGYLCVCMCVRTYVCVCVCVCV